MNPFFILNHIGGTRFSYLSITMAEGSSVPSACSYSSLAASSSGLPSSEPNVLNHDRTGSDRTTSPGFGNPEMLRDPVFSQGGQDGSEDDYSAVPAPSSSTCSGPDFLTDILHHCTKSLWNSTTLSTTIFLISSNSLLTLLIQYNELHFFHHFFISTLQSQQYR